MNDQKKGARAHVRVWSAGGVVARQMPGSTPEVVVCHRREEDLWALPKGTPDGDESPADTALREVSEETGLEVEILAEAGTIGYSFSRSNASNPRYHEPALSDGTVFDKQVHFYLMRPVGGDTSLHDHEFDAVVWLSSEEARQRLTYESESGIVEKALAILEGRSGGKP
jgi:bis(5'-nucleosidyl)-tetraphosphatase